MTWKPIALDQLTQLIKADLLDCDETLRAVFSRYSVIPYHAPIERYGLVEMVYVVAKKANEVMYYEDVEEGFNISPISEDGKILEHSCNQDPLKWALKPWL